MSKCRKVLTSVPDQRKNKREKKWLDVTCMAKAIGNSLSVWEKQLERIGVGDAGDVNITFLSFPIANRCMLILFMYFTVSGLFGSCFVPGSMQLPVLAVAQYYLVPIPSTVAPLKVPKGPSNMWPSGDGLFYHRRIMIFLLPTPFITSACSAHAWLRKKKLFRTLVLMPLHLSGERYSINGSWCFWNPPFWAAVVGAPTRSEKLCIRNSAATQRLPQSMSEVLLHCLGRGLRFWTYTMRRHSCIGQIQQWWWQICSLSGTAILHQVMGQLLQAGRAVHFRMTQIALQTPASWSPGLQWEFERLICWHRPTLEVVEVWQDVRYWLFHFWTEI